MGNLDRAYEDYTKAISIDSSNPSFFENRALVYISKGEKVLAGEDYRRALELITDERGREAITSKIAALGRENPNGSQQSGFSTERILGNSSQESIPGR
jgi:tetratricopeptide (TPR) repeat protein